jgi:uncharacterized membrane protein YdbT with pleckstrin-like domain
VLDRLKSQAKQLNQDSRGVMTEVRMIGGGLILTLIVTLVLTEVYNAINVTASSPFSSVVTSLETTGVAALSLLVVGFLVIAASAIMRYFGGGFGGGR